MQISAKQIQMNADLNQETYLNLKAELVYEICHADGSKFSLAEVKLLMNNFQINGEYNLMDCLTVYNCLNLIDYLVDNIDLPLNAKLVKEIHRRLIRNTAEDVKFNEAGEYRNLAMTINIAELVDFDEQLNRSLEKPINTMEDLANFLIEFDRLRPFRQHNLMVARVLCFYLSIKSDLDFVFLNLNNREYELMCKKAQITGSQSDLIMALEQGMEYASQLISIKPFVL